MENQIQSSEVVARKIIGLTGGIGSGKTTVAKFIEEMG
ncbi:MAG: dephospho-CoA kinase, partial [Kaistella sp.]